MGLTIEGKYYSKALDAGAYVPPSFASKKFKDNYDKTQWNKGRCDVDLINMPEDQLVDLVVRGVKQLGEIPRGRRGTIAKRVSQLQDTESSELALEDRKAELTALTIAELLVITRDHESITGEHSMRKAELIEAILDAEGEEDAGEK